MKITKQTSKVLKIEISYIYRLANILSIVVIIALFYYSRSNFEIFFYIFLCAFSFFLAFPFNPRNQRVTMCIFDKSSGEMNLTKQDWTFCLVRETITYKLSEIQEARVIEYEDEYAYIICLTVILVSGEQIVISRVQKIKDNYENIIFLDNLLESKDNFEKNAQAINKFLEIKS